MATSEMWTYGGGVRSEADLDGYEVEARDGSIGTVDEDTNEVGRSYVIVDTGPWIFGKRVLLPAGVVERVDHNNRRVYVSRTREEIKRAPEYDVAAGVSAAYRQEIGTHYATGATVGAIRSEAPRRAPTRSRRSPARSSSSSSQTRSSSSRKRSQSKSSNSRGRSTRGRTSRQSEGPTKEELYAQAKRLNIEGRSKMNKAQLARAVGRRRGGSTQSRTSQRRQTTSRSRQTQGRSRRTQSRSTRAKANPVEVQAFLDGVSYPTRKGDLVREAERSGARREVRTTLERLPEERFESPTEVSEAIGKLRR
jgi:hypothetical protein